MKRNYELGLCKNYIKNWTMKDAIRELHQNAIDQANSCPDNAYSIDYNEEKCELRISNKSSVLEKSTLLLGNSTKGADDIGGFGEGYKLACLVCLRNNVGVTFENFGAKEIWKFRFAKLKKYDYKESLVCDVQTDAFFIDRPNDNLTIVLSNLAKEVYEEYSELLIKSDAEVKETSYGKILLDEDYKGRVYVNGLFVSQVNGYEYGYDIKPQYIKIGRDRNLIAEWDLSTVTRDMWLEADDSNRVMDLLDSGTKDVEHIKYSWGTGSSFTSFLDERRDIADSLYENIEDKFGKGVIVTTSEEERHKLSHKYSADKEIVVVSDTIGSLIKDASEKYMDTLNEAEEEAKKEDKSTVDKIYCWGLEHNISNRTLELLFDILGDKVEAKAADLSESEVNSRCLEYSIESVRKAVFNEVIDWAYIDMTDNDDDKSMSIANQIMEDVRGNWSDEDFVLRKGEILEGIPDYVESYYNEWCERNPKEEVA